GRSLKYLAGFGGSLRGKFGNFSRHHGLADVGVGERRLAAETHLAINNRRASGSVRRKLPRTTGRQPVLPGRLLWREGRDDFFEARIAAQRVAFSIQFQVDVLPR